MTKILLFFRIWKEKRKRLNDWKAEKRIKWLAEGKNPKDIEKELKLHKMKVWKLVKDIIKNK